MDKPSFWLTGLVSALVPGVSLRGQEALNVFWILLDDTGFATSAPFGGLIDTPTFDYLASHGLRYNQFHSAAISAATRACLLTGRNHHSCHMGRFNDDRYGAPGYDTYLPMENGTAAEILRENGYATICVGKYNLTPFSEGTLAGPFNRWPTGRGFDHYYGFNPAVYGDDQWHPKMYRDTHRDSEDPAGRTAISRFADEAINYIADWKTAEPDRPFFLYFAPGTAHTPFQASRKWIDHYAGRFDEGWDEYARKALERQIQAGIVPPGTVLPEPNAEVPRWDDLAPEEKRLFARQMEVFAAFISEADAEIGRIVDYLSRLGELDRTLIVLALGDNGASGDGGRVGSPTRLSPEQEREFIAGELALYDRYGGERTSPFYPAGWAQACNTPFRYYKKWADYEGSTRDGLILHCPALIRDPGGIRTRYVHAVDILPTTLELIGAGAPETISGYPQTPFEGTSFASTVLAGENDPEDPPRIQYYELNGSYALYRDGWKVSVPNGILNALRKEYRDTLVHLYYVKEDFNERHDLSAAYPGKVRELLSVFDSLAWKYPIYPLKNGKAADPAYPDPGRTHYDVYVGERRFGEYPLIESSYGNPWELSVYIDEGSPHDNGILASQKHFALYVLDGTLVFATDNGGRITAREKIPAGQYRIGVRVSSPEKRRTHVRIRVGEKTVAEGDVPGRLVLHGRNWYLQAGRQWGPSVNGDYDSPFPYTGSIFKVSVDIDNP